MTGWKKWSLGVFATIVLGAIGSGLWDLAGKPAAQWLGGAVLTGVTLGSSAIKDSVYREAARGVHEASALEILGILTLFATCSWWASLGYLTGRSMGDKENAAAAGRLNQLIREDQYAKLNDERIKLRAAVARSKRRLVICTLVLLTLLAGTTLINYLKLLQASNAYTYFAQSLAICAPYIDDHQKLVIESRYAAVSSRADYIAITDELARIAITNGRKLPDFKPW